MVLFGTKTAPTLIQKNVTESSQNLNQQTEKNSPISRNDSKPKPFSYQLIFHAKIEPLRSLLKKDTDYNWNETLEKIFQDFKNSIHENLCLAYFNPNANTSIQVDSSILGLGATLTNDNKIIAFSSKRQSDAESRYENIERESYWQWYLVEKDSTCMKKNSELNLTTNLDGLVWFG